MTWQSGDDGGLLSEGDAPLDGADAGSGCPADIGAAVGQACSHEEQGCGGAFCNLNPCIFCHVIFCASGVWQAQEVIPMPCDSGSADASGGS
jgi:hypothetical protein